MSRQAHTEYAVKYPFIPPLVIMRIFESLRRMLISFSRYITPANVYVLDIAQSFYLPKAIEVVTTLNIPDYLRDGPKPVDKIAAFCDCDPDNLFRLMRFLAGHRIFKFKRSEFSLNKYSFALTEGKGSVKYMVMHQLNRNNWSIFNYLDEAVKTGKPIAEKVLGKNIFQALHDDPQMNQIYNHAMANMSYMVSQTILARYNFNKFKTIVDLGGGNGELLVNILERNSKVKAILFDLPHVVPKPEEYEHFTKQILNRLEIVAGDLFSDALPDGDAFLMKSVIHFMNDTACIEMLTKIKTKLAGTKRRLLIIEPIISENDRSCFGKTFDIQLMTSTDGGRERTIKEYSKIIENAGLRLHKVTKTISPFSVIEIIA